MKSSSLGCYTVSTHARIISLLLVCLGGCRLPPVPYQTYDNSLNLSVGNCLKNQSAITGLEAAGASLAVAAGGQGLGTVGLDGDAKVALGVAAAVSGLVAASMTAVALGVQSRMKMKNCEVIMEKHRERMNFEIELKKAGQAEPKWWPAPQAIHVKPSPK